MSNLRVGDVVRIWKDAPMDGGKIAYVYATYLDFNDRSKVGVQLISEDGNDSGGWSHEEQQKFLTYEYTSSYEYHFTNVIKLDQDFRNGLFNQVFKSNAKN